jgi:hypothetical protein
LASWLGVNDSVDFSNSDSFGVYWDHKERGGLVFRGTTFGWGLILAFAFGGREFVLFGF